MSEWTKIDLFDFEKTSFESQMDEIVVPLFEATDRNLTEWRRRIDDEFQEAISNARHEADETNALGEAAYRGTTVDEQRQLMGAACLGFVATAVKECLNDMAKYFKNSHPPGRDYVGSNWLAKRQDEYKERFQIDFTTGPVSVERIYEVILARNAGLHWDGSALDEYRRRVTSPRFIEDWSLTVGRENFLKTISDAKQFIAWVHTELKKYRTPPPAPVN